VKGERRAGSLVLKHHQQTETSLKIGLGAAIRRERSILGISQGELAERPGLHRTYVSDLERGTRNPSVGSLQKLARALQIPVAKLFERAGTGDGASRSGGSKHTD